MLRGYIVQVGDTVPNFSLTDVNGQTYTDQSLLGQTYILQFTASWCSVCRQEMPHLEAEVWQSFRDRNFTLLGVDLDEPKDKVAAFATQMGISLPHVSRRRWDSLLQHCRPEVRRDPQCGGGF